MPELKEAWLRFVDGRPVSGITTRFLQWCCQKLEGLGKKVLLLIFKTTPALAHKPRGEALKVGSHNRALKKGGKEGVRIATCLLPK